MIGTKTKRAVVEKVNRSDKGTITTVMVRELHNNPGGSTEIFRAYLGPGLYDMISGGTLKEGVEVIVAMKTAPIVMGVIHDADDDS